MRGTKGEEHFEPSDPPRRRANKQRGHGTYENDRPPIVGTVGRESGQVRLRVVHHTDGKTLEKHVHQFTRMDPMCYTDEWLGYNHIVRRHASVCHAEHEWARDDDGDGIREVHVNTVEGFWSLLRSWLRPHRGISQEKLPCYLCFFEFVHNARRRGKALLPALLAALVAP